MKKRLVILCVIVALIIRCFTVIAAAIEINEDFESYTGYVGGKWYSQGNGNIPVVLTDRGKSACITSTSSKMNELIQPFSELGKTVKSFKVSYSIYFEDNKSNRSLYVKDSTQGEFPLLTFMANSNEVSVNGANFGNVFTYDLNTWYDVTVQLNVADGIVELSISDGTHDAHIYGFAAKTEAWRIYRIDFASFTCAEGESVCYVDDVSFVQCEPFAAQFLDVKGGIYETFDYAQASAERLGIFEVNAENEACTARTAEVSGGNAAELIAQGGAVSLSAPADFLASDSFMLSFMINKLSATSCAEVYLTSGKTKLPLISFDDKYAVLPNGQKAEIPIGTFANIDLHAEPENGTLTLNVGEQTIICTIAPISSADALVLSAGSYGDKISVLLDNIQCFPADSIRALPEVTAPEFEDVEFEVLNEDFDSCGQNLPEGFFTQVTPKTDTSSYFSIENGTLCLKSQNAIFEVIKPIENISPTVLRIDYSIMLPDSNAMKSLYIRTPAYGEMRTLSFNTDKTVTLGNTSIAADVFTYKTNVVYDVSLSYNLHTGKIQTVISDGTSSHTLTGDFKTNVTDVYRVYFVNFACTNGTAVTYIDNLSVSASDIEYPKVYCEPANDDKWLVSSYPCSGDTAADSDMEEIRLSFVSAPTNGIYLLNGTDSTIKSVSYSGNSVGLQLYGLEKNTHYTLSYSGITLSNGDIAHGRITFTTNGGVSVSDIGFKDISGNTSAMNSAGTACWFTASSKDKCRIYAYAALYDRSGTRMLNINVKSFDLTAEKQEYDMHIDVPEDISLYNMKVLITDDKLTPLKTAAYALPFARPNGSKVMKDFAAYTSPGTHPRLVTTRNEINRIRSKAASGSAFGRAYRSLLIEANNCIMSEPVEYSIPDGIRLLSAARQIRTRIETLGIVYQLTGEQKYAERLYAELENAASFPDWNPRHFLDCATMMAAFALGYDYAYDYISSDSTRKQTVIDAVVDMGFEPLLDDYLDRPRTRTYKWTLTNEPDNWNVVCNSGAILAALSFAEELPQYTETVFEHALPLLETAAVRFGPDGAWFEGIGYWDYTLNYYADILTSMQNCLGTDYGFSRVPGLDKTGYFLHAMTGSGGVFNFSDSGASKVNGAEIFSIANATGDKELEALHYNYMIANNLSFGYKGITSYHGDFEESTIQLPEDWYFRDTEAVSLRSGYDTNDTFVGFCAGENFVPHAHLDIGSFVLDMLGQRFVCDLGSENYNIPDSVWNLYRNRAEGHNVPVINPDADPDQRTNASAVIDRFYTSDTDSFAVCDMTDAYSPDASSAIRGIRLTEDKSVVLVQDEIKCSNPSDIWWFMHTEASVKLSDDGKTAILTRNGKSIKAEIISGGTFSVMDASPLKTSPQNDEQNKNAGFRKLAVNMKDVEDVTFAVVFMPADYTHNQSDIISIKNWK